MTVMRRTSPFSDMLSLRQAMDHLFEESFVRPRSLSTFGDTILPLDVYTTPDQLVVEAALPGLAPEQVEITLTGNSLTISADTQPRAEDRSAQREYLYQEIRRGAVSRTVTLPAELETDKAVAAFEHGLLRLSIPKAERTKPRRITIRGDAEASQASAAASDEATAARAAQPVGA